MESVSPSLPPPHPSLYGRGTHSSPLAFSSTPQPHPHTPFRQVSSSPSPHARHTTPFDVVIPPTTPFGTGQRQLSEEDARQAQDGTFRKIAPPKPWNGIFNFNTREEWISSARAYLASGGVTSSMVVSEQYTPAAYYNLRSLFEAKA
ncbi:hypothetical protein JCM5350_000222, partial [Sporobolomyces pararoseus]